MDKKQAKSKLKSFGNGLLSVAAAAADLPAMHRMSEIEQQIDKLQEEYAELNESLSFDRKRQTPYTK